MNRIAIAEESVASRLAAEMLAAIPASWRALWRGPVNRLRIHERDAALVGRRLLGRPVFLEIAASLVLRKKLVIPAAGRRDLPFAVELLIGSETPFVVDEVFADVRLVRSLPETGELAFEVRLVPRQTVLDALARCRIKPSHVRAIAITGDPRPFGTTGLLRRRGLGFGLGWLVPVVVILASLGAWVQLELEQRRAVVAALQDWTSTELAALRASQQKLDEISARDEGDKAVLDAFAGSASTFAVLHGVRATLPASTTVTRVQMQAGEFRFFVASPDALRDVKALQDGLEDYEARIDGSVVDGASGSQSTVFLVTPRSTP